MVMSCSTTLPGRRCVQYTSAEWLELEQLFAESWSCHEGTDESAILLDLERTDFFCTDEALETRCFTEGEEPWARPGYRVAECAGQAEIVTGRYNYGPIEISTKVRPYDEPLPLHKTSLIHELVHRRLDVERGDADVTHEKAPGPWTEGHNRLVRKLMERKTVCE